MKNPEIIRECPECGEKIMGRSDKKFCCDACRSAFNNRRQSTTTQQIRAINRYLQRNRNILMSLNPNNTKQIVRKDQLLSMGFNFTYYTHIYNSQNGHKYYFCYDYAYLPLTEKDKYLIVHQHKP